MSTMSPVSPTTRIPRPVRHQITILLLGLIVAVGLLIAGKFAWADGNEHCLQKSDGQFICLRDTVVSKAKGTIGSVVQITPGGSALVRMLHDPMSGGQGLLLEFPVEDLDRVDLGNPDYYLY